MTAVLGLGGAFFLLLWRSDLEAERLNVGTLLGRDDPDPTVSLLTVGLVLIALAAGAGALALRKR
jgi:hypothetical protein